MSIAKITFALTKRLPGKSSTARRLPVKSSTARRTNRSGKKLDKSLNLSQMVHVGGHVTNSSAPVSTRSGRCSSVVKARLLRFWEAKNVKRVRELMWMDLLMVDVNIPNYVSGDHDASHRLPQFREKLTAGTMFSVSGFDVSRCAQNFRLTDSSLLIRFNESTYFEELTEPVSPLPEEAFRFRNQSELIGLANTNTQLPGILHYNKTYFLLGQYSL
ncbi:hypothetical protein YC2023_084977 [Brassica napus]